MLIHYAFLFLFFAFLLLKSVKVLPNKNCQGSTLVTLWFVCKRYTCHNALI